MIQYCKFCGDTRIVAGPRNAKEEGICNKKACLMRAYAILDEVGLLTDEQKAELEAYRNGAQ